MSSHLSQQFRLAFSAPCHSGQLFSDIGFLGDTAAAHAILEGRCVFPDDTDPATRLLLEEAVHTYARMSRAEVATYVTVEDFEFYWRRQNERVLSSFSGLHMGHYKAAVCNDDLLLLHVANSSKLVHVIVTTDLFEQHSNSILTAHLN